MHRNRKTIIYVFILTTILGIFHFVWREASIFDARSKITICPVHLIALQEDIVPFVYGLPKKQEYAGVIQKEFPFARSVFHGGCMKSKEKKARIHYCDKCRQAKTHWIRTHSENSGATE